MRILRVMNLNSGKHTGPYSPNDNDSEDISIMKALFRDAHYDDKRHPLWQEENLKDYQNLPLRKEWSLVISKKAALAGFKDNGQYEAWFDEEERQLLHENGFFLYSLNVSTKAILYGSYQVIFDKRYVKDTIRI